MDNISLLNLEGAGMAGFPGVASRLFGALQRMNISVILISQVKHALKGQRRARSVSAWLRPLSMPSCLLNEHIVRFVVTTSE